SNSFGNYPLRIAGRHLLPLPQAAVTSIDFVGSVCADLPRFVLMRNLKDNLLTYLKGMAMGAADVVPGVSGGSIALIAGIYGKLLDSINAIDVEAFHLLRRGQFRALWSKVNGSFLLALLLGIFTSILTLANLITYLIKNHPIPVWSFFCGLIIISALMILRDVKRWNILAMVALPIGVAIAYWITGMAPGSSDNNLFFIFGAGMIAICAMILPGISGSFLLLVMGKYEYILNALVEKIGRASCRERM